MDIKDILFKKVQCTSFLKKVHDGKYISIIADEAIYLNSNTPEIEITSECCGDTDFLKTYYEIKEKSFSGFVVGIKEITVTAWLMADTEYDYFGSESLRISRQSKEVVKCAIVYYGNNCKRYVPMDSIRVGE